MTEPHIAEKVRSRETETAILEAARNCPVDSITVEDTESGEKLCPED